MKNRSPIAVFFLPFITFGIYAIVWEVKTKNEMNKLGAEIPTAWLIIIPFVSLYWLWKYSEGVEKVTQGKLSGVMSFVLLFLLGMIGAAIIQDSFNKVGTGSVATTPYSPPNTPQPDNSFGGPVATPAAPAAQPPAPTSQPITTEQQPPTSTPTNPLG